MLLFHGLSNKHSTFREGVKPHFSFTGPVILGLGEQVNKKSKAKVSRVQAPDLISFQTYLCGVVRHGRSGAQSST